jgi:hypothetical protein
MWDRNRQVASCVRGLGIVFAVSVSGAAWGQTVVKPRFYMWGDPPSGAIEHHPHIVPNISLNLQDRWRDPDDLPTDPEHYPAAEPAAAAKAVVLKIIQYKYADGWLGDAEHPKPINILLNDWGADNTSCDRPRGVQEPDYRDPPAPSPILAPFRTRYFLPEDRLLPMNLEWDDVPGAFPLRRTVDNADARTARSYRHPFLRNAGYPVGQGIPRPLREWTMEFVAAYRALQTYYANLPTPIVIPNPSSFFLDTEAPIALPPDSNPMFMIRTVAEHDGHRLWYVEQVPGYPSGTTFSSLYFQGVTNWGWPVDTFPYPDPNMPRPGILNGDTGVFPQVRGQWLAGGSPGRAHSGARIHAAVNERFAGECLDNQPVGEGDGARSAIRGA